MKKIISAALIVLAIGLALSLVGFFAGGRLPGTNALSVGLSRLTDHDDYDDYDDFDDMDDLDELPASGSAGKPSAQTVNSLHLELDRGQFRLAEDADKAYTIEGENADLVHAWVDHSGVWQLECLAPAAKKVDLVIYLPPDTKYQEIEIEGNAQAVSLGSLAADEIELELNAGTMDADSLTCRYFSASINAGSMAFDLIDAANLEFDATAGEIIGKLAGAADDYCYSAETKLGSITLGKNVLAEGLTAETSGGSGRKMLELECDAGSIDLQFAA